MMKVQSHWVKAYSAGNPMEAELLVGLLHRQGIRAGLRSQGLMGGIGELPMDALYTPVWVPAESLVAAKQVLTAYEAQSGDEWRCQNCAEVNGSSFELCWQCGEPPAEPTG
ncbi:hypothetical protein CWE12_00705 [Aliidiomarina sedimenti]|uniref:RanBP2-type domain-containing protein n=1 Tax=Aliidiomarina sedimenti TaxID=1933879 RepID=A0ABY0C1D8_9GAMM|nr:DUF2007 domain-containing protein [Aliidiomarina sedimenti]RUO31554.1 hypothetical protein CWE12_00705 [Aliidiomarina sedimenti]